MSALDSTAISNGASLIGGLPAEQIDLVGVIHNAFLRSLAPDLGEYLETPVTLSLAGLEQVEFSSFLADTGGDACRIRLDVDSGQGCAVLAFPAGFVFRVLGILIGAPPDERNQARRSITEIESHVLRECFEIIARRIRDSWTSYGIHFGDLSIAAAESRLAPPARKALSATFTASFGDYAESFRMAVPALLARMAVRKREPAGRGTAIQRKPDLLRALSGASFEVEAALTGARLRVGDLLGMAPGQVLALGLPADSRFECVINGKPKFRGRLLARGNRPVFQMEAPLDLAARSRS